MTTEQKSSSSGVSAAELRGDIEELLKYLLQSYVEDGPLEFDLGLPKDYCSYLLSQSTDHVNGVPLYKILAAELYEIITSEEDIDCSQKQDWGEAVVAKRFELLNILRTVNFELHVQEPYFTQLRDGLKTVEGRCSVGDLQRIKAGDIILFNKCLVLHVKDVHHYASFYEMLEAESLKNVLPGVNTIEEGVKVYRKFYTEEEERSNGVLAICVTRLASQPFKCLAEIVSMLSYDGIRNIVASKQLGHCGEEQSNSGLINPSLPH